MQDCIIITEEWNEEIILKLEELIEKYKEDIDLKAIGFPKNWKEILLK